MAVPLRVLLVEDVPDDAALVLRALRKGGYDPVHRRVETADELRDALQQSEWDIVIADHALPQFSGDDALTMVREEHSDLPFILVSGTIGEDVAVAAMKAGAHDYVLKQNLARLVPAIDRELREAQIRRERRREVESRMLLEEVSAAQAPLFDPRKSFACVARLSVPRLADGALAELVDGGPSGLDAVAVVHRDSTVRAAAQEQRRQEAPEATAARTRSVLTTGEALLEPPPGAAPAGGVLAPLEGSPVLRAMQAHSALSVPLSARGRILGVLTLVSSDPRRRFDGADLRVALELAHRTAFAVDNARLYESAREAVRLRDDFLAVASHELRTPLTALRLQLQLMERLVSRDDGDPRLVDKLERALRQSGRLSQLVESLLDVTRISSGHVVLKPERFDFAEVVRDVVTRLGEEAQRAGCLVNLRVPDHLEGSWDRLRIEQVLVNLLSNAFKYGAGHPVDVGLARIADTDCLRLWVRDHGIGIASEAMERIFGRFERAASMRAYGGLGLGLYISREIVESHGGTIAVQSELGLGALFIVELPLETPERAAVPENALPMRVPGGDGTGDGIGDGFGDGSEGIDRTFGEEGP